MPERIEGMYKDIDWLGAVPFVIMMTAGVVTPFLFGVSWAWLAVVVGLYFGRMFFVTGILHRYFSHLTFQLSRLKQFLAGLVACTAVQQGPVWWAAHHRHHHKNSDTRNDVHSPILFGFWYSQVFWIFDRRNKAIRENHVRT